MRKETVSGEASCWRQKYWAEWGRPFEGPGAQDDRGGPAYIPWLEAKLDDASLEKKIVFLWLPLIGWLIFAGVVAAIMIFT